MNVSPIVMLSSVVRGFEDYRSSAIHGIRDGGAIPIAIPELTPASSKSSRNECLDAVQKSDLVICVLFQKYGSIAPSGMSVCEEEFNHAVKNNKNVLALIVEADDWEDQAENFKARVLEYVKGRYVEFFKCPEDLGKKICNLVRNFVVNHRLPLNDPKSIDQLLTKVSYNREIPQLITTAVPLRNEDLFEITYLEETAGSEIQNLLYSSKCPVFDRQNGSEMKITPLGLVIYEKKGRHMTNDFASRVIVGEKGMLLILQELNLAKFAESSFIAGHYTRVTELSSQIRTHLSFISCLFELYDKFGRFDQLYVQNILHGAKKGLVIRDDEPNPTNFWDSYNRQVSTSDQAELLSISGLSSNIQRLSDRNANRLRIACDFNEGDSI